jgi:hypothetical protein
MNSRDPKLVALLFNECINSQDIEGLSSLMSEDHIFIDRKDDVYGEKEYMVKGWIDFFKQFPEYKNTFVRVDSRDNIAILLGYANWSKDSENDYAIWVAKIENDLVAEWRIYEDTEENKRRFNLI